MLICLDKRNLKSDILLLSALTWLFSIEQNFNIGASLTYGKRSVFNSIDCALVVYFRSLKCARTDNINETKSHLSVLGRKRAFMTIFLNTQVNF